MEHIRMAELRHSSVSDVFCPECQHPMMLVRVLPPMDHKSPLAGFYCRPCHFASTVALRE